MSLRIGTPPGGLAFGAVEPPAGPLGPEPQIAVAELKAQAYEILHGLRRDLIGAGILGVPGDVVAGQVGAEADSHLLFELGAPAMLRRDQRRPFRLGRVERLARCRSTSAGV
jgi:hypothetical protein